MADRFLGLVHPALPAALGLSVLTWAGTVSESQCVLCTPPAPREQQPQPYDGQRPSYRPPCSSSLSPPFPPAGQVSGAAPGVRYDCASFSGNSTASAEP